MLSGKPVWMAVRDCGGRGPYANSIGGRAGLEVCRGCGCSAQPATLRAREIGYGARVSRRLSLWGLEEKIGLVESQRDTERASARRVFALESVVSCSRSDQTRKPENCPARGRIAHGVIRDYRRRRPCSVFDRWVDTLKRAGIEATQIGIAEYDRERGYNPITHPRGREVYVLVPVERLEEALRILKASEQSYPG